MRIHVHFHHHHHHHHPDFMKHSATPESVLAKSSDEAPEEPLDMRVVMAERRRVVRGVASGELDPEAMNANNTTFERAFAILQSRS